MINKTLLIIDDEENMCHMLQAMLESYGYTISTAVNGKMGLRLIKESVFDFILCDVRMPEMDGLSFLEKGKEYLGESTLIMMSAFGSVDMALEAMKAGAYDFISKPFKSDEVILTLKKAEEREQLRKENKTLKERIASIESSRTREAMIAQSNSMQRVLDVTKNVAQYDTTVLVTGESGTGKELIARALHQYSPRKKRQLVVINCGSIPESLIESELFGHVKGAFTGAEYEKQGVFEQADGSTLFLDEIGELPLLMQVKLLRVIQENEIRKVGGSKTQTVDVRIIAATARDLQHCVEQGTFREDLFYRLNVLPIELPPLRQRKDDIPLLCHHFIKKFNSSFGSTVQGVAPEAMTLLLRYSWPGNIRELENAMQRGIVLTNSRNIETEHLPAGIINSRQTAHMVEPETTATLTLKDAQKQLERRMISNVLLQTDGNKSQAARTLNISYPSLLTKIKEHQI